MLSDSDREVGDLHTLTLNDHYSKAFQYRKEREELAKCGCIVALRGQSTDDVLHAQ